jgi:hypothetical protein
VLHTIRTYFTGRSLFYKYVQSIYITVHYILFHLWAILSVPITTQVVGNRQRYNFAIAGTITGHMKCYEII